MKENQKTTDSQKKKATPKQIAAIIGIVLLLLLYAVTLFAAIFGSQNTANLFGLCFFATIALPIVIWIYIWVYGKLTSKSTIADFHLGEKPGETEKEEKKSSSL